MKRVLFIAYHFPPMGGAPTQRTLNFTRYLPGNGYLPVVITGPGKSLDQWTPGDNSLCQKIPPDIPVHRVETGCPVEKGTIIQKVKRWSLLESSFSKWWIKSAIKIGENLLSNEKPSLIYASMSPFESGTVAAFLSKRYKVPWVADLRDAWALDEIQVYPSFIHRKIELLRMYNVLKEASLIVMNTNEAKEVLLKAFPNFRFKNVCCITNGFDPEGFKEEFLPGNSDKFRIVHSGSFLTDLGLEFRRKKCFYKILRGSELEVDIATRSHLVLLEAIERWAKIVPDIINEIEIVFIGSTSDSERNFVNRSLTLENLCRFTGYLPRGESLALVCIANLLFLSMHNLPEGKRSTSVPSKMFEYMASGQPILAAVPDGDARDLLRQCGTAFLCRPDDAEGMLKSIRRVYNSWKKGEQITRIDSNFVSNFDRRYLTKCLAAEFDKVLINA